MKVTINEGVGESQKAVSVSGNFVDCFNMLSQLGYIDDTNKK